jgi:hypothetical protein
LKIKRASEWSDEQSLALHESLFEHLPLEIIYPIECNFINYYSYYIPFEQRHIKVFNQDSNNINLKFNKQIEESVEMTLICDNLLRYASGMATKIYESKLIKNN